MSFNRADSFFVPDTPPTTKSQKAAWERTPTVQGSLFPSAHKMTDEEAKVYKALMDTSSDSDGSVQLPTKMTPDELKFFKDMTGQSYESDNSVKILNDEESQEFEKKMGEKTKASGNKEERALKRLKLINADREQNQRAKKSMFVPEIVDVRIIFIRDHFVGGENYTTTRAVNNNGVVYKRVILKDGTFAHNFIVSAEQLLFKIDGETVMHKTPGASGIVNISRTNRVPFSKLFTQTFENEVPS